MTATNTPEGGPAPRSGGDVAHAVVRAAIGSVPYVGAAGVELFTMLVAPPLARRQSEWMDAVAQRLSELEAKRGISVAGLAEDPAFIDVLLLASKSAISTHHESKREALRNAVMNVACGSTISETNAHLFIRLLENFTPLHLQVLQVLHDPTAILGARAARFQNLVFGGSLNQVLIEAIPMLANEAELLNQLVNDLNYHGLVNGVNIMTMMTGAGLLQSRSTERGRAFLAFISEP